MIHFQIGSGDIGGWRVETEILEPEDLENA